MSCLNIIVNGITMNVADCSFLGRLPNFESRPNTIGGKFPSVRPSVHKTFLRFR